MDLKARFVGEPSVGAVLRAAMAVTSFLTQATVGGSPFGPYISVAKGHSRE